MSIGATLQAARQAGGLSVDDVAISTRIRATLIRQIESENFAACGGAIYARGHIRNIAAAVGLDPAPIVAEFNATQGADTSVPAHQILDRTEIVQRSPTGPNWTAAMFVTAVLLAIVAFVSLLTGPDGTEQPTDAQKPSTTAAAPLDQTESEPVDVPSAEPTEPVPAPDPSTSAKPSASEPVDPPPSSSAPVAPSSPAVVAFNGVRLQINVTGARCWVRVTDLSNAKKVVYQGVLEKGAIKDFTATSKLLVTFGDAAAVNLTVNGRDIGAPGGRGKVVTTEFVPGDPAAG